MVDNTSYNNKVDDNNEMQDNVTTNTTECNKKQLKLKWKKYESKINDTYYLLYWRKLFWKGLSKTVLV